MKTCNTCGKLNEDTTNICVACKVSTAFTPVWSSGSASFPPPEPETRTSGRSESKREEKGAGTGVGSSGTEQNFLEQVRELAGAGDDVRRILFFGHSNSGKTWVIARVKAQRHDLNYSRIKPVMEFGEDADGLTLGIPTTKGMHLHAIMDETGDGIAMLDIEGDTFEAAAEIDFRGGEEYSGLLEAVGYAQGFVFVAPAGETLHPKEYYDAGLTRVTEGMATRRNDLILNNIQTVARLVDYFERARRAGKTVEEAAREFSTSRHVRANEIGSYVKTRKPAILLLSKADAYQKLCERRDEKARAEGKRSNWAKYFDVDPMGQLAKVDHPIRSALRSFGLSFRRFRVDFVTACPGHNEFPNGVEADQDVKFKAAPRGIGVMEAMDWLKKEIDSSIDAPSRLDFGVAPALWMRRMLLRDRAFAKVFKQGKRRGRPKGQKGTRPAGEGAR